MTYLTRPTLLKYLLELIDLLFQKILYFQRFSSLIQISRVKMKSDRQLWQTKIMLISRSADIDIL